MSLPGRDAWGEPADLATAHAVLRRAVELGVNFIDTAAYYGPNVANRLIREALHPYPPDLVIATKVGMTRGEDKSWRPALRPEQQRVTIEDDLRTLGLEQLPVVHMQWSAQDEVTFDAALDALIAAQREGKVRHIALSNVTVEQLDAALGKTPIVAVQSVMTPGHEQMLAACEKHRVAFIPFAPAGVPPHERINEAQAKQLGCSPAQLAIAWQLARSPVVLPIPGTSKVTHLEDNLGAVHVALDEVVVSQLAGRDAAA
jgi:aryl-alcohol dehydrogenase-like predicted oxidoreductase